MRKYSVLALTAIFVSAFSFLVFSRVNSANEAPKNNVVDKVMKLQAKQELDAAIKEASAALSSDPNNVQLLILSGQIYTNKGEFVLADKSLKKALNIAPKNVWGLRSLAANYKAQYEKAKKNDPKDKNLALAQATIEKALAITPNDHWVNAEAAAIYLYQQDKAKALKAIEVALKADPKQEYFKNLKKQIDSM